MTRIHLNTRTIALAAVVVLFIYVLNQMSKNSDEYANNVGKTYSNTCSFELLNKVSLPLLDFERFPCLNGVTPTYELQTNGRCVRTVNLPKSIRFDQAGCVLHKFGRGTLICTHSTDKSVYGSHTLTERDIRREKLIRLMLGTLDGKPNKVLLDIGCDVGAYTLAAALYSIRVICVDANFENLFLVSKSLTLGKLWNNVTLIWNAISGSRGTHILRKEVSGVKLDNDSEAVTGCDIAVNKIKLDDLRDLFIRQEVYIKLDAGGLEHDVLNSGKDFFENADIRYVQLEFEVHRGRMTGTSIIDRMSSYGFLPYTDCEGKRELEPAYHFEWPCDVCFIR